MYFNIFKYRNEIKYDEDKKENGFIFFKYSFYKKEKNTERDSFYI